MATTVNDAFREFMANTVNLDPDETELARKSRDWLVDRLRELHVKHADFPLSYAERDSFFGSFHRRTKIRDLDDIDLISCMKSEGAHYLESPTAVQIFCPEGSRLRDMCFDGTSELNSRRVINRFVQRLADIPQYNKAEVGRNGEAAVLDLGSYTWKFDIVAGFFTVPEWDGRTYYIIPDGNGRWKKTDPRIDQDRVTVINQKQQNRVLNPLRAAKFWNRRSTMPTIPPYALENLILSYYDWAICTGWVDVELAQLLPHVASAIYQAIPDPKGLQGDLNTLSWEERRAVSARAHADANLAREAREAETALDHRKAIRLWGNILGPFFPTYG